MKKLLVAIRPDDIHIMEDVLAAEFQIILCHTLADARSALAESLDAIVCGLHFDDGNMFELLQLVRSSPATKTAPFFCIKGVGGELSPSIFKSIVIATEKMGADGFVDISDLAARLGERQAYDVVREALHHLLDEKKPA
jgi:hypothetical protein